MRLRRLSLLRYGHLSDVVLDIPPTAALCVVHGANEAGKSTALAAIGDALFGFGHRTAFDFLHGGPQLRVGFTLTSRDGTEASFIRRKGRSGTLRDGAEEVVPEAALQRFLGGASRELFEHMFGLDGDRLRGGGAALAQGGGGVGESLFAAGTGLLGLRAALAKLDEEAKTLVGDGRGKRRMSEAVDTWRQAQREAERLSVLPRAWQDAEAAHADALAGLSRVHEETGSLYVEANRLQRVRRVAPLLSGLEKARATHRELADAPQLPADAEATLQRTSAARDQAGRDAARETAEAARLTAARDALPRNPALLAVQDEIDLLAEQRPIAVQAEADLPGVRLEVEGLRAAVAEAVPELGLGMMPEAARDAVPNAAARRAVQKLVSQHAALTANTQAAARDLKAAATRRDEAEEALRARPAPADPALLRATIDQARGEGRLDAELARSETKLAAARDKAAAALAALPLWRGDAVALAACPAPLPAEMASAAALLASADEAAATAEIELKAIKDEIAALEDDVSRLARGETVPTPGAVLATRVLRDRVWRLLRRMLEGGATPGEADTADLPPAPLPDAFETLRNEADRLADRRADEAQRVADYMNATARLDLLRARQAKAVADQMEAVRLKTAANAGWRDLWAPAGLIPAAPAAMTEWGRRRNDLLKLAEEATEARWQRDDLATRREAARGALQALLSGNGADETLAAVLTRAEVVCAKAEAEVAAYRALEETLARETSGLLGLKNAVHELQQEFDAWRAAWAAAVVPLGLQATCTVDAAEAALGAWGRIAEAAPAWNAGERRIDQMTASVEAFEEAVRAVLTSAEPKHVVAARLIRELADARQAEAEAEALTRRIKGHEQAATNARDDGRAAEAELAALRLLAGAVDDAGLEAAIGRTRRRDASVAEIARLGAALAAQGDGLNEVALQAEAADADPDAAAARLAAIETETGELGIQREALSAERTRAEAALYTMGQGQDAAGAAQEARQALAEAATAAEQYARLHVARVLLRSGIDRFRRAQQGPLLQAAGQHFAALTGGRYVRLGVDEDAGGRLLLVAVQDEGTECPVEALSEGARDQLYLALRTAAVEAHAANAEPLPFIADDLLVHFDDVRAAAAIALLAQLARTTQVILFTHHDHVAALAASQATADVMVLRLPDLLPARIRGPGAMALS